MEWHIAIEELIVFERVNTSLRLDGNMAIAWSASLKFSVENPSQSIVSSVLSEEGVVHVYRGTGKVLMAPTMNGTVKKHSNGPEQTKANTSDGVVGSVLSGLFK